MPSASQAILSIKILADAKQATQEIDKISTKTKGGAGAMAKVGAAGVVVLGALAAGAIGAAKAAVEDAHGQEILAHNLKAAAKATDEQIASTEDWILKQSLATGVADDQLRPALSSLALATGDVTKAQDGLSVALDVSAATGKDLGSITDAMAKAYAGNTGALGRLGLGIDKATLKSGDMSKIMDALKAKTNGAAAAAGDTAAGKFKRMQVAITETKESLGGALLPAINAIMAVLQPLAAYLAENEGAAKALVVVVAALAAAMVAARVITALTTVATIAQTVATKAASIATKAWAAAQWLLDAAMAAFPITLIILGIVALVAVIVVAYNKSATFRAIVQGAFNAVLNAARACWNWIRANWPLLAAILLGPFGPVFLLIRANFNTLQSVALNVFNTIKGAVSGVVNAFKTVVDWIQRAIDKLRSVPVIGSILGKAGVAGYAGSSQGLYGSTLVTGQVSRAAAIGRTGGGGAGGVVININGAIDTHAVARQIRGILQSDARLVGLASPL